MMRGKEFGDFDVRLSSVSQIVPAPKVARCTQSATRVARSKIVAISFA
jgi:hypothetical protein